MDKYEYKIRAEEIKTLISQKKYAEAARVADTIDWTRVKSVMMLCTVSDVYKVNRRFDDAKLLLEMANERHPSGRMILYSLCDLAIRMGDVVGAVEYYKDFEQVAPNDSGRYVLQYKLYEAQNVGLEERIAVLEELKKKDYREKWAYELAYLYHRVGLATKCVEECDELILWFGEGKYVMKAMELKTLHQPLTPSQQKKFDAYMMRRQGLRVYEEPEKDAAAGDGQRKAGPGRQEMDIRVKTMDVGKYNTVNLQKELAASMKELMQEGRAAASAGQAEERPGAVQEYSRQRDMGQSQAAQMAAARTEAEWGAAGQDAPDPGHGPVPEAMPGKQPVPAAAGYPSAESGEGPDRKNYDNYLSQEYDGQISMVVPDEQPVERQITGQMDLNDIMRSWERVKRENEEKHRQEIQQRILEQTGGLFRDFDETSRKGVLERLQKEERIPVDRRDRERSRQAESVISAHTKIWAAEEVQNAMKAAAAAAQERACVTEEQPATVAQPAVAAEPAVPEQPVIPTEPVVPVQPAIPTEAAVPVQPVIPTEPAAAAQPASASEERPAEAAEVRPVVPEQPAVLMQPAIAEQPAVSEQPAAAAEAAAPVQPASSEERAAETAGVQPVVSELPVVSEQPVVLEQPAVSEQPAVLEQPAVSEQPVIAEQPAVSAQPAAARQIRPSAEEQPAAAALEERKARPAEQRRVPRGPEAGQTEREEREAQRNQSAGRKPQKKARPAERQREAEAFGERSLTGAEKRLFASFVPTKGAMKRLVCALDQVSLAAYTGNLIITGEPGSDTLVLAKNVVKDLKAKEPDFSGKAAKVTGGALNGSRKPLSGLVEKLAGGVLMVEKAGEMDEECAGRLMQALNQERWAVLVILMDTKRRIRKLLEENPEMEAFFNARFDVEALDNSTLVAYGCQYARMQEYAVDELGRLALHTRIEDMQTSDHIVTVADVREIVDEAIDHAERKTPKHLIDVLLSRRYDENDMIILHEGDFI